jgi:hypothetical protein
MILSSKFFIKKEINTLRWQWKAVVFIIFVLTVWIIHEPLLIAIGQYLEMPSFEEKSDCVIIEGGHTISALKVEAALNLYKNGKTNYVLFTLNTQNGWVDAFGLVNYKELIKGELKKRSIPDSAFSVHYLDVTDPFTYNTAFKLIPILKEKGFTSLSIVHDNFHNRRSYLTYKKVMEKHGIYVYAKTIKIYVNAQNWYKSGNGIRRVFAEYIKLAFYKARGYI